jgi:ABC-type antimicrobial peptide transport system permease subunit
MKFSITGTTWSRVVGVVGDIRHLGPSVPPRPEVYQADTQVSMPFMAFVVRTEVDPHSSIATLRRAAAELDPALPLAGLKTMDEHMAQALAKPKFFSSLVSAFGALAVTLALVGIYAMMAWSVSERRQEFAIRLALGAGNRALVRLIVGKALLLTVTGLVAGLIAARAASGVVAGLLYGIRPTDPATFAATAAIIALVALVACYAPVRRALRVNPVSLLR